MGDYCIIVKHRYGPHIQLQRTDADLVCTGPCRTAYYLTSVVRSTELHLPTVPQLYLLRLAGYPVGALRKPG